MCLLKTETTKLLKKCEKIIRPINISSSEEKLKKQRNLQKKVKETLLFAKFWTKTLSSQQNCNPLSTKKK